MNKRTQKPAYDEKQLLPATLVALAAIIALPVYVMQQVPVTPWLFALPLLLAIGGPLRDNVWLVRASVAVLAAVLLSLVPAVPMLEFVPFAVTHAGPIAALAIVGPPLRDTDLTAAVAFLVGGTLTAATGLLPYTMETAILVTIAVALATIGVIAWRIRNA